MKNVIITVILGIIALLVGVVFFLVATLNYQSNSVNNSYTPNTDIQESQFVSSFSEAEWAFEVCRYGAQQFYAGRNFDIQESSTLAEQECEDAKLFYSTDGNNPVFATFVERFSPNQ